MFNAVTNQQIALQMVQKNSSRLLLLATKCSQEEAEK